MVLYALRASKLACLALVTMHSILVLALCLSGLDLRYGALIFTAIMLSLLNEFSYVLREAPRSVMAIIQLSARQWCVQYRHVQQQPVTWLPSSVVTRYFLLLQYREEKGRRYFRRSLLIFRDSLAAEELRQLRAALLSTRGA